MKNVVSQAFCDSLAEFHEDVKMSVKIAIDAFFFLSSTFVPHIDDAEE